MRMTQQRGDYALIDSGAGRKLERFGKYVFSRPCATAVWAQSVPAEVWEKADGIFDRDGGNAWVFNTEIPVSWNINLGGLEFKLSTTGFGHVGVFPEHATTWELIRRSARGRKKTSLLNLFAYSGGATLAAAQADAKVCHLDASRGMTMRARENAKLNRLDDAPIRWIVDDVGKFLDRELRRGNTYDAIVLDPPSFGRGKSKELFKIETSIMKMLDQCRRLLSAHPRFLLLSCHTPAFTPAVLENLLTQSLPARGSSITAGELFLTGKHGVMPVPSGTYAVWQPGRGKGRSSR
jgi:23S rRNA (cytosine1962-C5)-methyltransferase